MTIHPMLLEQSAQYRQEELRGLGVSGRRARSRLPSLRAWHRPRLHVTFPITVHPRPASSR